MSRHAKDFESRKASAMETARWLLPDVQRAEGRGDQTVELKIQDIKEVIAYLESSAHRERIEFAGRHLGFIQSSTVREYLSRKRGSTLVLPRAGRRFDLEVFYLELPPLSATEEVSPDDSTISRPT